MFKRKLVLTLIVAAAPGLFAQTTASSTYTNTQSLPPVGLSSTETIQINAVNVAAESSSGTAASCTGSISFVNAGGTTIGTATSYTLTGNELKSVSLPYSQAGASGRAEIRGVITQTATSGVPCHLLISLETFDTASGVTHVYLTANAGGGGSGGPGGGGPGH